MTRARARLDEGDLVGAELNYRSCLAAEPSNLEALRQLGVLCAMRGALDEAATRLRAAVRLAPRDAVIHGDLADVLMALDRFGEARRHCDIALALDPQNVEALNNRANVLCRLGETEEAISSYRQALAIAPDQPEVWANLGMAFASTGRGVEALGAYDRALAIAPGASVIHANRAVALLNLGRVDDALAAAGRALALDEDNLDAKVVVAKATCEKGDIAAGFSLFREVAKARFGVWDDGGPGDAASASTSLGQFAAEAVSAVWGAADPKCVVIDDFLSPQTLSELRAFCRRAPIWRAEYARGYVGAFPESGFASPLLARIAEDLRTALPAIFADQPLRYAWAFKYQPSGEGTHVHADEAAVNVNFWITPDEANLEPERGGLVFWDRGAPADWSFSAFNADRMSIEAHLERSGARAHAIPYRANRAVIFDSNLFHKTDAFRFAAGPGNERINVTMLFGRRQPAESL